MDHFQRLNIIGLKNEDLLILANQKLCLKASAVHVVLMGLKVPHKMVVWICIPIKQNESDFEESIIHVFVCDSFCILLLCRVNNLT